MVPPPNATGDEFPDFDSMTPEEQMAWLESLARRQGAKPEEFTTAADLEIAEVSPDTVIDEPGYIPYSISEKPVSERPAKAKPETPPEPVAVPPLPPVMPEPVSAGADELPDLLLGIEPEVSAEKFELPLAETDPMQWLGSLSAQSEAELPEPMAIAEEDTAEFLAGIGEFEDVLPESAAGEMASGTVESADPLGGMDPMLWLESLAKRQGANLAELTTSANLEIEEPPKDTVIDEPGYVPYDVVAGGPRKVETAPVEHMPEPEPEPEPALDFSASFEPETSFDESYELSGVLDESSPMLDGVDPMEWLESLAKRQGAKVEELTTSASLTIPEMPEDTVIDEPGYIAFSPFGAADEREEYERPEPTPELDLFAAAPEPDLGFEPELVIAPDLSDDEQVDQSLAWLADLASEPGASASDLFGASAEIGSDQDLFDLAFETPDHISDDILAGMTDDEVAYAQAHGQLSPQQELEWLKRQAAKLADVRQGAEEVLDDLGGSDEFEVVPASPGQIPSWLEDIRSTSEEELVKAEGVTVFEETVSADSGQADLGDWLNDMVAEGAADVSALSFDSDVDSLWAEINDAEVAAALDAGVIADASDLFSSDAIVSGEQDQLAEALDSEYERKLAGDNSEPDWYRQAVQQEMDEPVFEAPVAGEPESLSVPAAQHIETSDLTEAVPVDMPAWLLDVVDDESAPVAVDSDMPAWLTENLDSDVTPDTSTVGMPDWLTEVPEASMDDMGWLEEEKPTEAQPSVIKLPAPQAAVSIPQPEPVVAEVEPEVVVPQARSLPQGELFVQYRQRLERNPNDHATRLALARALRTSSELEASLDQYEALIEVSQLLPDIGADLGDLVREHDSEPRIRRLLGDTYMRKGMLQEALDAYRSALNKL